ncbi:MAG: MaoC family dehydratase N-terminal domain-containing protein [Flavobacteriales bacterium]|nr:MaoC family dehydratase N-terminal domain-containing protein [Flavobacteriales bacterium]
MEVSSDLVGIKTKPFKVKVTRRHSTNYAAAIGDLNPLYFDNVNNDVLVSHPVFAVALSWELNSNLNKYVDYPMEREVIERLVHQSEQMEIKRLFQVGEEVSIEGEVIAVMPHDMGTKIVIRFDYMDSESELILREHTGGLIFGMTCSDEGKGKENVPISERVELADGEKPIWEKELFIDRNLPYLYDGCANISAAIHTSPKFATSLGLPDIILHGTASLALSVKELTTHYKLDPRKISALGAKFTGMIVPGNNITLTVLRLDETDKELVIDFEVMNTNGEPALRGGRIICST